MGHGVSGWVAANRRSVINADPALDVGDRFDALDAGVPQRPERAARITTAQSSARCRSTPCRDTRSAMISARSIELISGAVAEAFGARSLARGVGRRLRGRPRRRQDASIGRLLRPRRRSGRPRPAARSACCASAAPGDGDGHGARRGGRQPGHARRGPDLPRHARRTRRADARLRCRRAGRPIADASRTPSPAPAGALPRTPLRVGFACSPYDGASVRDLLEVARRQARCPAMARTGSAAAGAVSATARRRP